MIEQMIQNFPMAVFGIIIGFFAALAVLVLLAPIFFVSVKGPLNKLKNDVAKTIEEMVKLKRNTPADVEKRLNQLDRKISYLVEELNKIQKRFSHLSKSTMGIRHETGLGTSTASSENAPALPGHEHDLAKMNKFMSTAIALLVDIREKLGAEKISSRQVSPNEKSAISG